MAISTVHELVTAVGASRLLEPQQEAQVQQLQRQFTDPRGLAKAIVDKGWLTAYQIKRVANGKTADLTIGQYTLIDVLGEGGMGQVFKAKHRGLNRVVALKVIRKERLTNPDAVRRFLREIRATSQLAHPNIVLALDAEQAGDTHFIAMEYVEGADLLKLLKQNGPLPAAQACDYAYQTALGLQHAFEVGLVHRDIKPSNLLVTTNDALVRQARSAKKGGGHDYRFGLLKILDLGLARIVDPGDGEHSATLTHAGAVVGTPDYVSPEQARDSRTVDIRSDIYSLGCTLFHLLANRVVYPGGTGMEKLFKHQIEATPDIAELRPDLPRGLADLVARTLAKQPADRPQTPAELAKLLLPFAQDKSAGPAGLLKSRPGNQAFEQTVDDPDASTPQATKKRVSGLRGAAPAAPPRRGRRWLVVGASMVATMLFICGGGILFVLGHQSASTENAVRPTSGPQVIAKNTEPVATAIRLSTEPLATRPLKLNTERVPIKPIILKGSVLDHLDAKRIPATERLRELPPEVVAVFGQHRFRHWGAVQGVAFSPDRKHLATVGTDRYVRVWDLATGEQRIAHALDQATFSGGSLAFNPAGTTLTMGTIFTSVKVIDLATGKLLASLPNAKVEGRPLGISPNGLHAAIVGTDGAAHIVDLQRDQQVAAIPNVTAAAMVVFAGEGTTLAYWNRGGKPSADIHLWDFAAGKERLTIPQAVQPTTVAFSRDGKELAVVQGASTVKTYSAASGQETSSNPLTAAVAAIAYAPDSKTLAMVSSDGVHLLNPATGADRVMATATPGMLSGTPQFSPDGQALALVGGFDPTVRMWNVTTGKEVTLSEGLGAGATALGVSPDGRTLVASSGYTRPGAKIWDVISGKLRGVVGAGVPGTSFVALTPAGQVLTRSNASLTLWDAGTGAEVQSATLPNAQYGNAVGSANGQTVFVSQQAGAQWTGTIYDGATLKSRGTLENLKASYAVAVSADGKRVVAADYQANAMGGSRGRLRLWDGVTGKEVPFAAPAIPGTYYAVAISPDGRQVAGSASDGSTRIWDVASGNELVNFAEVGAGKAKGYSLMLSFAPTGDAVAGFGAAGLKVWDPSTGKERSGFRGHAEALSAAVFAPHGQTLASIDRTGTLILWNVSSGAELRRIQLPGPASGMIFSADGNHLITANSNGTVYVLRLNA